MADKLKLLVQDAYAFMDNEPESTTEISSGILKIKTEDDRTLFEIALKPDGSIDISSNDTLKLGDVILDTQLLIKSQYCNCINVSREIYNMEGGK